MKRFWWWKRFTSHYTTKQFDHVFLFTCIRSKFKLLKNYTRGMKRITFYKRCIWIQDEQTRSLIIIQSFRIKDKFQNCHLIRLLAISIFFAVSLNNSDGFHWNSPDSIVEIPSRLKLSIFSGNTILDGNGNNLVR